MVAHLRRCVILSTLIVFGWSTSAATTPSRNSQWSNICLCVQMHVFRARTRKLYLFFTQSERSPPPLQLLRRTTEWNSKPPSRNVPNSRYMVIPYLHAQSHITVRSHAHALAPILTLTLTLARTLTLTRRLVLVHDCVSLRCMVVFYLVPTK